MTGEQLVDASLRLFQREALNIYRLTWPAFIGVFLVLAFTFSIGLPPLQRTTAGVEGATGQFLEAAVALGALTLIAAPLFVLCFGYASAITSQLVAAQMLGTPVSDKEATRRAGKSFLVLVRTLFVVLLRTCGVLIVALVALGISAALSQRGETVFLDTLVIFLFVASLVIALFSIPIGGFNYLLSPTISALESVPSKVALARSKFLMKAQGYHPSAGGHVGSLFVAMLLLALLFAVLLGSGFVALLRAILPLDLLGATITGELINMIFTTAPWFLGFFGVAPFFACAITALYIERRVRLEALDIEVLAGDVRMRRVPS